MAESDGSIALPDELGPVDYLLHRGEANPRTRSGIMALELLDSTPNWERFRARFENASRRVVRLRQKVVVPTLPTASPRWVIDPDFNLEAAGKIVEDGRCPAAAEVERRGGRLQSHERRKLAVAE